MHATTFLRRLRSKGSALPNDSLVGKPRSSNARRQSCFNHLLGRPAMLCAMLVTAALFFFTVFSARAADGGWGLLGGRTGIRAQPLWKLSYENGGDAALADDLTAEEAEVARRVVVRMLGILNRRKLVPFPSKNYAQKKGVLDRWPLERVMDAAAHELGGSSNTELNKCVWAAGIEMSSKHVMTTKNQSLTYTLMFN
jgi:hypothetical protein